jgi:sodium-dependent dicarboxylate transporter 2/3/5
MPPSAMHVSAVALLMATWWLTEAIPIPATALLPVVLFPALGVTSVSDTTVNYANHIIFLFMGGFLIAITIEKWHLHRRIALHTIRIVGMTPKRIILGFMLATAFLSMWISNTATCMMMVTIGIAVMHHLDPQGFKKQGDTVVHNSPFATALMLSIAYSASIGGVATLIGTPPNAILAGIIEKSYGISISFTQWMVFALPLSAVMLGLTWFYLTHIAYRFNNSPPKHHNIIQTELMKLGPMSREERLTLTVFSCVALAWIIRGIFDFEVLNNINDSVIAITGAIALFIIPSNWKQRQFLLDWDTARNIPWDIIILFGGGFALANAFNASGLTGWIGDTMTVLHGIRLLWVIVIIAAAVIFLTEVTSNTATASLLLPVFGALAVAIDTHPLILMATTALAASFAFMLPVATPPNAIVFSSRQVTIPQMARAGFWLNLAGIVLIALCITVLLPLVWGIGLE